MLAAKVGHVYIIVLRAPSYIYCHLSSSIFISHRRMVKTRRQAQLPQPTLELQPVPKKRRAFVARPKMSRQELRERVAARMQGEQREGKGKRKVDFSSEDYISIAKPEKFNCPVCLDLMIYPIITDCGHAFCLPCLEEALKHKPACSLCRKDLDYQSFSESKLIREIVEKMALRLGEEEQEEFQKRRQAFIEKDLKRCIDPDLDVGESVDFYMEGMWHEGNVMQISRISGEETVYEVQAINKQRLRTKLKQSSRLLAKHRFFSKQNTLFRHYMGQFSFELATRPTVFDSFSFFDFQLNQLNLIPESSGLDEIRFILSIQHS